MSALLEIITAIPKLCVSIIMAVILVYAILGTQGMALKEHVMVYNHIA